MYYLSQIQTQAPERGGELTLLTGRRDRSLFQNSLSIYFFHIA